MRKGISILALAIVIMLGLSIFSATSFWGTRKLFQKRIYEQKITKAANSLETYSYLIDSASDLATIQAIHDVGYSAVIYDNEYYNSDNYLPYYPNKQKIKTRIIELACIYYEKYENSYINYFKERNKFYNEIEQWELYSEDEDRKCEELSFSDNKIEISFGNEIITYHSNYVESMKKTFPVESSIKTKFNQLISTSENVKNEIVEYYIPGKDYHDVFGEGTELTDIESAYSDNSIKVELIDEGDYIFVHIYEEKLYPVYDFQKDEVVLDYLGLKFLVEKTNEHGILGNDLDDSEIQMCGPELIIKTKNENICESLSAR